MKRHLLICIVLAACASDDSSSTTGPQTDDTFDRDCGGMNSQCARISARWSLRYADATPTCDEVHATQVEIIATYQPDGRATKIWASCAAGATLSKDAPLGPYKIVAALADEQGHALGTGESTVTLAAAGVVGEAEMRITVKPIIAPGDVFGACSENQPCKYGYPCVYTQDNHDYCSPTCTSETTCVQQFDAAGAGSGGQVLCVEDFDNGPKVCVKECLGDDSLCPTGMKCSSGEGNSICVASP